MNILSKAIEAASENRTITTIARPLGDQPEFRWATMPDLLTIAIKIPVQRTDLIRPFLSDLPATYVLQSQDGRLYVGESCEIRSRLLKHTQTADKSHFASAYVLASRDGSFDRHAIERREYILTKTFEDRGLFVERGKVARNYDWNPFATPIIDRQIDAELQMLVDLGLDINPQRVATDHDEDADGELSPPFSRGRYYALQWNGVTATAFEDCNGSVHLLAGSTYRANPNPSLPDPQKERRDFLEDIPGLLVPLNGETDILQFNETVVFQSLATAGRIITGTMYRASQLWTEVDYRHFTFVPTRGPISIPDRDVGRHVACHGETADIVRFEGESLEMAS